MLIALPSCVCAAAAPTEKLSDFVHRSWQDKDGLPENNVLAMAQTTDGYLWVATEEGLARFDGVQFTVFSKRNTPAIKNNIVTSLIADGADGLWIGTYDGVVRMKNGVFSDVSLPASLRGKTVTAIYRGINGSVWIGVDGGGLGRIDERALTVTVYSSRDGLGDDSVFSIAETPDGALWIGTRSGLSRFKDGRFRSYGKEDGLPGQPVQSVLTDEHGDVWIATHNQLSCLHQGEFRTYGTRSGLSGSIIKSLYEDKAHTIWISTVNGIERFQHGSVVRYTKEDGWLEDEVNSVFVDRDGSVWVGNEEGLDRYSHATVHMYTSKDGLPSDVAAATYEDHAGNLWIGTAGHGVARLSHGKTTIYDTKNGLLNDTVFSVIEDRNGDIWIGTRSGVNRLSSGKLSSYTNANGLGLDSVDTLFLDRQGTLWMGGRGGLSCYRNGRFISYSKQLHEFLIFAILEDHTGALWLGSSTGLLRFRNGEFTLYTQDNSALSNNHVMSLYEDSDDVLWIGTQGGGLNRLQDGTFTHFSLKDGLLDDRVFQILDGNDGSFWLSSNLGISRVKKQELAEVLSGQRRSVEPATFGTEQGMRTRECNGGFQPAGWRTKSGLLLFPTMKGVAVLDPKEIDRPLAAPTVVIETVQVDKDAFPVSGDVVSRPGRGELEFQYTVPNFLDPQKTLFQYKLEGYDHGWVDAAGARTAHYTNIPPRRYRFLVRARTVQPDWGEASAVDLVLRPHFYQTYWFYLIYLLAAGSLVGLILKIRVLRLQRRGQALAELVDRRTAELQGEIEVRRQIEADLKQARDEAIQARDELHFQANHDTLTGLWNRRAILDLLERELERSVRSKRSTALLMLDADHFKKINDAYGHPAGDAVLFEIARRIVGVVRDYDAVGRYGGEELMVMLPECDALQAMQSAERIRLAIAEMPIVVTGEHIQATVSIGVAATGQGRLPVVELLRRADAALYEAKSAGRNRTVLSGHAAFEAEPLIANPT